MLARLQYISQGGGDPRAHLVHIEEALEAGVKLVQLRLKNSSQELYIEYAHRAKELCTKHEALLIINDEATVAKIADADALHLGLEDMGVPAAKKIIPGKMIGGTANTFGQVKQRCVEGVNYIGLGPYRFTTTKEKLSPVLGIGGYTEVMKQMLTGQLYTPIYAIGGIQLEDIAPLIKTGVYGIAVSGLITASANKTRLVKEINNLLYHA